MEFSASKYPPWRPLAHRRLRWWPRETGEKHATFYFCMGPGLGGETAWEGEAAESWLNRLAKVVVVLCTMSGVDDFFFAFYRLSFSFSLPLLAQFSAFPTRGCREGEMGYLLGA
jgi:hypothetical protein